MSKKNLSFKHVVIFYVDVGQLPPDKVHLQIEEVKNLNSDVIKELEASGQRILYVPVRPNSATRVEVLPLDV
jgi:hypothetical protein